MKRLPPELCPISGDWSKLGIPSLTCASLMSSTAFTAYEIFKDNKQGLGSKVTPSTQINYIT